MHTLLRVVVASAILSAATVASAARDRSDLADALIRYVKSEYKEARDGLLPLAQGGDPVAQELIAFLYLRGDGVPADEAQAFQWFWLAANGGRVEAQYELGRLYRDGLGVQMSGHAAVYWFSQAAGRGAGHAMNALGELYCGHPDLAEDYAIALAWFTKAAESGSAQAMLNIGFLYASGRGVERSEIEAIKWFDLAMAEGPGDQHDRAARAKAEIAERLTPVEVRAASTSAKNWLETRRAGSVVSVR